MTKKSSPQFFFNHAYLNVQKNKKERFRMINTIINSGHYLNGQQNEILEDNLKKHLGKGYITTTASGHDALYLSLLSLNLNSSDEIIFPVNCYPTAFPICMTTGKPTPIDVDHNGQLDIEELKKKINKKTKVIVLVHLYGYTTNITEIVTLAKKNNIILIEDCAQSFGSTYLNKPLGTFGDISCFSFYPTKNLATLGDGGAIWTKHKKYFQFILKAKSYGEVKRYHSEFLSGHSRLPEIQAGILNLYFKNIFEDLNKRKKVAQYFCDSLKQAKLSHSLHMIASHPNSDPIPHLFVVQVKKRDSLKKFLKDKNIETFIHYPTPIHLLPAFKFLNYKKGDFPVAEKLSKSILSLPFHQSLSKKAINYISKSIKEFYNLEKSL